jgi:arylsulfatase A-like enzyme
MRLQGRTTLVLSGIAVSLLAAALAFLGWREKRTTSLVEALSCTGCNVVLIVIDALRADHLGVNGYQLDTSPFLDRLAERGVNFTNVYSQESYTIASVSSIFTSTYPSEHGVLYDRPGIDTLPDDLTTIAEVLKGRGYATAAIVFNPHLRAKFNFGQGFDLYNDNLTGLEGRTKAEMWETAARIYHKTLAWLGGIEAPFFLYLHYRDVHAPYLPPEPWDKRFPSQSDDRRSASFKVAQYDGEIGYTDEWVRKLIEYIEKRSADTLFVITADHGEAFGEHGEMQHGNSLYEEEIRIPLLFYRPGRDLDATIDRPVESIDITPTLLDLLGIPVPAQMKGRNLFQEGASASAVYSGGAHGRAMLVDGGYKYYRHKRLGRQQSYSRVTPSAELPFREELYDLRTDPDEKKNLIEELPDVGQSMRAKVEAHVASRPTRSATTAPVDEETRRELRALGYLVD